MLILFGYMLLLSSAPLCLLCSGIMVQKAPRNFKRYIFIYIFGMAVLVYSSMPNYENDLVRYFMQMENCRDLPFSAAFTWANDGLVVKNFVFWIIGKIGDLHLLPALAATIYYGVSAYIAADQMDRNGKHLGAILLFQVLAIPFFESMSNVRNVSAFALIILAAYRDIVQRKRNIATLLLYIVPCFIHMSGFVLVAFRFAGIVFKKHPVAGTLCSVGIPSLTIYVFNNFRTAISHIGGNIGLILSRAILKAYTATSATSRYATQMHESGYFNACRLVSLIILLCLITLTIHYMRAMRDCGRHFDAEYAAFVLIICDIAVIWDILGVVKYSIFATAAYIACAPVLVYYLNQLRQSKLLYRICVYAIQAGAVLRFGLELYFMRTRLLMEETFQGVMLNNAYVILWRFLRGIAQ